jgi:GNAT superfamily N-acetyltransferase
MSDIIIRRGAEADLPHLATIELDAATAFDAIGYDFCAAFGARSEAEQRRALQTGAVFVAETARALAGFLLLWQVDGAAHVLELDVARAAQVQGIGRRLMDAAEAWARLQRFREMTLTTFSEVPWNRPWYESLGFTVFAPGPERPELLDIITAEKAAGVWQRPRCALRKPLRP